MVPPDQPRTPDLHRQERRTRASCVPTHRRDDLGEQTRAPRCGSAGMPGTVQAFRDRYTLTAEHCGTLLGLSTDAIEHYEREGTPAWLRFALLGIAATGTLAVAVRNAHGR